MAPTSLAALLNLTSSPVAITFVSAPPAGIPHVSGLEPAGCGYWRRAAAGELFYTVADDHKGCPVGAHTHAVPLTQKDLEGLNELVATMVGLGYLEMEEAEGLPSRRLPFEVAVYSPLDRAPLPPDLVLVRGNARQLMLLSEAAAAAGVAPAGPARLRPTCSLVPDVLNNACTSMSFGCVGNRVYTGAGDGEAYFGIPGRNLSEVESKLAVVLRANEELERYHRSRLGGAQAASAG